MDRKETVNEELLSRFFNHQTTSDENEAIYTWIQDNPENEKRFNDSLKFNLLLDELATEGQKEMLQVSPGPGKGGRIIRFASIGIGFAASLLFGIFLTREFELKPLQQSADKVYTLTASAGQRSELVLGDGTKVNLNSGSTIEYPAVFRGNERRVRINGEAMFDVEHDEGHPFIVETFAYDIKVLGTRFDVIADRNEQEFTTALFEGKVQVLDKAGKTGMYLSPDEVVYLKDGELHRREIQRFRDDYQWTDGIISMAQVPFKDLMRKIERCYGVNIVIDRETMPEIGYNYLEVRISDGIDHALKLLQEGSDFTYYYNNEDGAYHIR